MVEKGVVGRFGFGAIAGLMAICFLMLVPGARAASVVNGDFETGTLAGWSVAEEGEGEWIAYSGTSNPVGSEAPPLINPPQGTFAASTIQGGPGTHILYQDVVVGSGSEEVLQLYAYYDSEGTLVTPESGALSGVSPNQQYRIDVMDPLAPIDSVDPADILATVLATKAGDPQALAPKVFTADLTNFKGQTVRLRMAEADTQGYFVAGVDSVSIGPLPPPVRQPILPAAPPSNVFTIGKLKLNKKNGTATLQVAVPGAGTVTAVDAKKKSPKRIKQATAAAVSVGTVTLKLKPTGSGRKTLKKTGKLRFKALLSFTPTGGTTGTATLSGKLKLTPPS